ncbi:MAG: M24 family metallopeptidase [Candidatus Reddybacter sp.]
MNKTETGTEISLKRLQKLQAVLRGHKLDGALLFHSRDIFYYTGTAQPGWLVITPDSFVLAVSSGEDFAARDTGLTIPQLITQRDPVKLCQSFFTADARIGTELDLMTVPTYQRISAALNTVELVNISPQIMSQRGIKDEHEIAAIRRAIISIDAGHQAALDKIQPGMTELEGSAIIENGHRLAGHEGDYFMRDTDFTMGRGPFASSENLTDISGVIFTISGIGLSPAVPAGASRREMKTGDLIVCDIPTCVDGYHADQTRTYALGKAPEKALKLHAQIKAIADHLIENIRADWSAGQTFAAAEMFAEKLGIATEFLAFSNGKRAHFVGHGIGLELNEPPFLSRGSKAPLAAGMVLAIELHACASDGTMVKLEDNILLTEEGAELLTISPRELIIIQPPEKPVQTGIH